MCGFKTSHEKLSKPYRLTNHLAIGRNAIQTQREMKALKNFHLYAVPSQLFIRHDGAETDDVPHDRNHSKLGSTARVCGRFEKLASQDMVSWS
jgi:hypothetical protein